MITLERNHRLLNQSDDLGAVGPPIRGLCIPCVLSQPAIPLHLHQQLHHAVTHLSGERTREGSYPLPADIPKQWKAVNQDPQSTVEGRGRQKLEEGSHERGERVLPKMPVMRPHIIGNRLRCDNSQKIFALAEEQ